VERSVYRHQDAEQPLEHILLNPFSSPYRLGLAAVSQTAALIAPQTIPAPIIATPTIPAPIIATRTTAPPAITAQSISPHAQPNDIGQITAPQSVTMNFPIDFKTCCEQQEIQWIRAALETAKYNQKNAAQLLGLTYHQIRALLRKYTHLQTDARTVRNTTKE